MDNGSGPGPVDPLGDYLDNPFELGRQIACRGLDPAAEINTRWGPDDDTRDHRAAWAGYWRARGHDGLADAERGSP